MVSGQTRQVQAAGGIRTDLQGDGGEFLLRLRILPVPAVEGKVAAVGGFVSYNGIGKIGADVAFVTEIGALQRLTVG